MFKKIMGLIAGFIVLMFIVTFFQIKSGTKTTAKELENKVIVYTTYDKEMTDIIKNEFEKSTSINVEVTKFSNDTDMVKAIKDKKNGGPDVILGSSTITLDELNKEHLLEANKPSWYYDISNDQKNKDGYWYSMYSSPIVMFYNTAAIRADQVPQNFISLNDGKYANLIVMPKVESIDFKYFLDTVISPYVQENKVDDGFKAITALKFNIKEYKDQGNQVIDAVSKKEGAIGIADLGEVNEAIKKGSTLAVVYGDEKYPILTDGIAIVKNCSNINAAKLFEEFAAGPKMQYKLATKFKLNPINKKVLDLCGGEISQLKDKTYQIDMNVYNANINSWIEKWNAIVKDQKPGVTNNKNVAGKFNTNKATTQINNNKNNVLQNNNSNNNGKAQVNVPNTQQPNNAVKDNNAKTSQNQAITNSTNSNNKASTTPINNNKK